MNKIEPPLADNILWDRLERLFIEPIILSQKDGEDFQNEIKEKKLNYRITVILNKNVEDEECKYVFRSTALGKQTIIAKDPIFQPENIRKMIVKNHEKYSKIFNNSDVRIFVFGELSLIDEVIKRKCSKGEYSQTNWERSLYFILQDYKEELNEYLSREKNIKKVEENDTEIDFKELKSIGNKILFLHETGVLDLLKSKYVGLTSVNRFAKLISQIIGEKHGSVQPVLNALLNDKSSKNYPNGIEKVKAILKQLD